MNKVIKNIMLKLKKLIKIKNKIQAPNEAIDPGAYLIFPIPKNVIKSKFNLLIMFCN